MKRLLPLFLLLVLVACSTTNQTSRMDAETFKYKMDMAKSYISSGDFKRALMFAFEAEAIEKTPEVYNVMGLAYMGLGELEKAKDSFLKAINLDPDYSDAWANLSAYYLHVGDLDKAIDAAKKALSNRMFMHPEVAYTNMAEAYFRKGRPDEALRLLDRALRYNVYYAPAYEKLIGYYILKGDYLKAKGIMADVDSLGLDSPGLSFYRALLLIRDGEVREAKLILRGIVRDFPLTPWAKRARKYLESLE